MKFLDCFCGLGGASIGFHREGFECTGIDIADVGYPYKFIHKDMLTLNGEDYRGYDVMWGSPPCRDFTIMTDATWKEKKNPERGLILVNKYLEFVQQAKPKIWIMENVPGLVKHLPLKPQQITRISSPNMKRAFWGTFPPFLMPQTKRERLEDIGKPFDPMRRWLRAVIPVTCSQSFAKACKEHLKC